MPYLLIRQKFVDYPRWRAAFDAAAADRAAAGITPVVVTRNRADADEAVVLFEVGDPETLQRYMSGPGLAESWQAGGVLPESNQATFLLDAPSS